MNTMLDIITIGTVTRDVFVTSELFKVLRDKEHLEKIGFKTGEAECFALGSKIQIDEPIFSFGGGAHNTAITFARQGFKTGIIAKVGNDLSGKEFLAHLKIEKIKPLLSYDKKTGTGYSVVLLTPGGERTILVYRGASEKFSRKDASLKKIRAKWAYISPGEVSFSVMSDIISELRKNGTNIAINPSKHYLNMKHSQIEPLLNKTNAVFVNREEASCLTGEPYDKERKIFRAFDEMIDGIAVVTDGSKGATVSDGKFIYRSGVFKEKKLTDRTGAGDAFASGFISGLMRKENDICYALRLAAANATSVVETVGASDGALTAQQFSSKRWKYLNLDVEPF